MQHIVQDTTGIKIQQKLYLNLVRRRKAEEMVKKVAKRFIPALLAVRECSVEEDTHPICGTEGD